MSINESMLVGIFLLFLLIFVLTPFDKYLYTLVGLLERRIKAFLLILFVISLSVTACFSQFLLCNFPNSADEYVYIFQANTFYEGRLWNQTHPVHEFFKFVYIIAQDGKWVGKYAPGWPAILALGLLLKIPLWLVNPLLGTVSLLVFFFLAEYLYGKQVAIVSVFIALCSAFFLINSASYFSHTSCLLMILLFVYFARRSLDEQKKYQALLAGVFIGFAFLVRPYTALLCALPFGIVSLFSTSRNRHIGLLLVFCGALPFVLLFLLYNHAITGHAFLPPHVWYNPRDILGFVHGHNLIKGIHDIGQRLFSLVSWSSPALVILFGAFIIITLVGRHGLKWEDLIFPSLVTGYALYGAPAGNEYGPRYYYEAYPFLILFVTSQLWNKKSFISHRWQKLAISLLLSGSLISVLQIYLHAKQEHQVVVERMDLYDLVEKEQLTDAIVFIKSSTGVLRRMGPIDLTRNGITLESDILYAVDKGTRNSELHKYFPDKKFYVYSKDKLSRYGQLTRLNQRE